MVNHNPHIRDFVVTNVPGARIAAENSACLYLADTGKGVLVNRMVTADRDAIVTPADGLLIYNTDSAGFEFSVGGNWQPIAGGGGGGGGLALTAGNSLSIPCSAFPTTVSTPHGLINGVAFTETIFLCVSDNIGYTAGQIVVVPPSLSDGTNAYQVYTDDTLISVTGPAVAFKFVNPSDQSINTGLTAADWFMLVSCYGS